MFLLFLSPVKFFCGVRKQDFWVGFSSGNIGCFNAFAALNGEQYIYIWRFPNSWNSWDGSTLQSSIWIWFSIINQPFWDPTFMEIPTYIYIYLHYSKQKVWDFVQGIQDWSAKDNGIANRMPGKARRLWVPYGITLALSLQETTSAPFPLRWSNQSESGISETLGIGKILCLMAFGIFLHAAKVPSIN